MNVKGILVFVFVFTTPYLPALATTINTADTTPAYTTPDSNAINIFSVGNHEMDILSKQDSLNTSSYKRKKRIAAILAFPFPFGLLGLHRVFLGTKPYIPFVYIGTLGGCFLILPIIDFISILSADEDAFRKFENNSKAFMWAH